MRSPAFYRFISAFDEITLRITSEIARRLRRAGRYRRALRQKPVEATVHQDGKSAVIKAGNTEIFFRGRDLEADKRQNADFALIALLVIALSKGKNFRLNAPVTESAFRAAQEYRTLWRFLAPQKVFPGRVECPNIVADPPRSDKKGAICLSGGVDSTHALLQHHQDYSDAILIRGADYPVNRPSGFDNVASKAARTAETLQVKFNILETNLRDYMSNWELFHTGVLCACLSFFTGGQGNVAWASDYTPSQELLTFPWGNMRGVADVLSSENLKVNQLDGGITRSRKVANIAVKAPWLLPNISLCYASTATGENCGKCKKCMWVRVGLAAFSDPKTRADIEAMMFGSASDIVQLIRNIPEPSSRAVAGSHLLRISDIRGNVSDPEVLGLLNELYDATASKWL